MWQTPADRCANGTDEQIGTNRLKDYGSRKLFDQRGESLRQRWNRPVLIQLGLRLICKHLQCKYALGVSSADGSKSNFDHTSQSTPARPDGFGTIFCGQIRP
jgi:hypothetical protein